MKPNTRSANETRPEDRRVFISRALALGAISGSLEALLALTTGVMPPQQVLLNFALLLTVFGGFGFAWLVVRTTPRTPQIGGDTYLILVSVLPFALRGCLNNCGEDVVWRIGVPLGIAGASVGTQALLRRFRPTGSGAHVLLVASIAMTLSALDFAVRDGLAGISDALPGVVVGIGLIAVLSSVVARRGWRATLIWTMSLTLLATLWGSFQVRPPWIEPKGKKSAAGPAGPGNKPNVVLLVLDTVRADHLSLYGYLRSTSPNLDALASESLVFDHAVASGNYSLSSHASLLTGELPGQHGARQRVGDGSMAEAFRRTDSGLAVGVETLGSELRDRGYATAALSGNYGYLAPWTGLQQGFDSFVDRPKTLLGYHPFSFPFLRRLNMSGQLPERSEWEGERLVDAASHYVSVAREPFFLLVNLFDAHDPYVPRAGYVFLGDGRGSDVRPIPAYDSEIAYVDAQVGRLVERLREDGTLDNTILIVTSDHGEFFGEHGFAYHRVGAYEGILHVPLLVRYPKALSAGRVQRAFGLHEVHRLIMDVIQSKSTDWITTGGDQPRVLSQVWGRISSTDTVEGARSLEPEANIVYMGSLKLVGRGLGASEMYDLAADPREEVNLLAQPTAEHRRLQFRMEEAIQALPKSRQGTDPDVNPHDITALRGLGYITSKSPASK